MLAQDLPGAAPVPCVEMHPLGQALMQPAPELVDIWHAVDP